MRFGILPLLLALVSPMLMAAPEHVSEVLQDLGAHGYVSPTIAAKRLQAAVDANDPHASLEQRRRYQAELVALALPVRDTKLLQQALTRLHDMASREHCTPCQVSWLIGKAQADVSSRNFARARSYLEQAASLIGKQDSALQLELAIAQVHLDRKQGASNVAFKRAMAALQLAENLHENAKRIQLLIDLSVINIDLDFSKRAIQVARQAISEARSSGFKAALALAYINLGYVHTKTGDRAGQLRALRQALAESRGIPGLAYVEAVAHVNLSDYHLSKGNYAAAIKDARIGATLSHAGGNLYGESVALANLGIAKAGMGDSDAAFDLLREAVAVARESGNLRAEATINQVLVQVLESAGRYQEALKSLQAIAEVNHKITQQERDNAVLALQAKYDDERKNREIEKLSTQARLKQAEAEARRWKQGLWAVLAATAGLAALLMVLRLVHARRANRRLAEDVANLTTQSSTDELTGVYSRRHFATLMQPYADDPSAQVGLVMLDVDHFKRINDRLGHAAGDAVLRELGKRLQALGRDHDRVVRWGGEEFVLILPDASSQGLPGMARRLLEGVAGTPFRVDGQRVHVSISAGCVVHPLEPGSSWEPALKLADAAMYRAKRHGRNRAACVTTVNKSPVMGENGDLSTALRASTIEIEEVAGPRLPPDPGMP